MSDSVMDGLYPALLEAHLSGEFAFLDESLHPRPPEAWLSLAGEAGLDQGMTILDVGCGRGDSARLLARRHGCHALGMDLALGTLIQAAAVQREERPLEMADFGQATAEALPLADGAVDLVLCRDMLLHVEDLGLGLAECTRVLRPGGSMLILATIAGEHLGRAEAAALFEPLAIVPRNLDGDRLEAIFEALELASVRKEIIWGERLEYLEQEGGYYSRELMRLARMRRDPDRYQAALGAERYEMVLALYTLSIYLLIGKLVDVIYWLKK
jgi:SAM-dependent methyltransferase